MLRLLLLPPALSLLFGLCSSFSADQIDDVPEWLDPVIAEIQSVPVSDPPISITRWVYEGETVYFVPVYRCCDFFSTLYDAEGEVICHPDGGIAGHGDGRCPDFFDERKQGRIIWTDDRGN